MREGDGDQYKLPALDTKSSRAHSSISIKTDPFDDSSVQQLSDESHDQSDENHFSNDSFSEENKCVTPRMEFERAYKIMNDGYTFRKYGKFGAPHERIVYLDEKKIIWKDIKNLKDRNFILIPDITEIKEGRQTKKFKKYPSKIKKNIDSSFSIITHKRTLDLEASNPSIKVEFISNLNIILNETRKRDKKMQENQESQNKQEKNNI